VGTGAKCYGEGKVAAGARLVLVVGDLSEVHTELDVCGVSLSVLRLVGVRRHSKGAVDWPVDWGASFQPSSLGISISPPKQSTDADILGNLG
jgi:hypothetical protein